MFPVVLVLIFSWIAFQVNQLSTQNLQLLDIYQARSNRLAMVKLAEGIAQYYGETGTFPVSLNSLAATPGYEHLRSTLTTWQGYAISPALTDGVWTFTRMVAYSYDRSSGPTPATYLATNFCGTGAFDTATSWCGDKYKSQYYRIETKEGYADEINTQRAQLTRIAAKFTDYATANSKLPAVDKLGTALAANSITAMSALAGYAGTAANCSGQYQYQGIPIDCSDMFDRWGGPIGYQFIDDHHVLFVSEPPIVNSAGNAVVVPTDLQLM